MAERRMFSKSIVLSDAFLDMPMSARCLYFTLSMFADDDGFVGSPKAIMRQCGASQDDIAILLQKRYILGFDSGVIVIKHWRMNNYLQNDRHKKTTYVEELEMLSLDSKGSYIERSDGDALVLPETSRRPLTQAQEKRYKAKKESSLPYSFEYKIRQAFEKIHCPICNYPMESSDKLRKPTIKHNLPISLGGKHEIDNISVICASCNTSIINRTETPPYNTEEVKKIWECIGNGLGMDTQYSIGKYREVEGNVEVSTIDNMDMKQPSTSKEAFIICAEQFENSSAPTLPLNDGTEYEVTQETVDEFCRLYPAVDVMQELRNMRGWLIANPRKRKTKRGINAFMNNWLAREQDGWKGGGKSGEDGTDRRNHYTNIGTTI